MTVHKDDAYYKSRLGGLINIINDAFAGLAKAGDRLPGGAALSEDILRVMARITAERSLTDNPPPRAFSDELEAAAYFVSRHVNAGVIDDDAASAQRTSDGRIRVSWRADNCIYRSHCDSLKSQGCQSACPRRLYFEQALSFLVGRAMGSIIVEKGGDVCVFEVFGVSGEMLRPMERVRRSLSAILQERDFAKDALNRLEARYQLILETIDDAIVVVSTEGVVTYVNPRACGVFGITAESALGQPFKKSGVFGRIGDLCVDAANSLDEWQGVSTIENRDGDKTHNIYLARFSRINGPANARIGTLIVLEDVTREELLRRELSLQAEKLEHVVAEKTRELQDANSKLEVLASTDVLTGLPNRRTFEEILRVEMRRATRYRHSTGLLMVDVDDFKQVNDKFGHQTGDEVLKHVAAILSKSTRSSDVVARWGGDEFSILLPRAGTPECEAVARRISENLIIENVAGDHTHGVSLSLSVGWSTERKGDPEALLARADKLMYDHKAAKKAGAHRHEHSEPKTNS